jgi:hypothetical protein
MNSFDRLVEIGFQGLTQDEIAQIFLWYYLRRYPTKKTASIKRIKKYFKKANMQIPSDSLIRNKFFVNRAILSGFRNDTYSIAPHIMPRFDERYGSCFEPQTLREKLRSFVEGIVNPKLAVWIGRIAFFLFIIVVIITTMMFLDIMHR